MSWSDFDKNGVLIERGNDTTRTVTTYDESGAVTSTRPYTADENATADAAAAQEVVRTNAEILRNGLQSVIDASIARQAVYQTVLNTDNATIKSNPAPYIKDVARQGKRSERAIIRLARLVGNLTTTADTGTD